MSLRCQSCADAINGLTKRQRAVLDAIAEGDDGNMRHPRVLKALMGKGLIEEHDVKMKGVFGAIGATMKVYSVPFCAHVTWTSIAAEEHARECKDPRCPCREDAYGVGR